MESDLSTAGANRVFGNRYLRDAIFMADGHGSDAPGEQAAAIIAMAKAHRIARPWNHTVTTIAYWVDQQHWRCNGFWRLSNLRAFYAHMFPDPAARSQFAEHAGRFLQALYCSASNVEELCHYTQLRELTCELSGPGELVSTNRSLRFPNRLEKLDMRFRQPLGMQGVWPRCYGLRSLRLTLGDGVGYLATLVHGLQVSHVEELDVCFKGFSELRRQEEEVPFSSLRCIRLLRLQGIDFGTAFHRCSSLARCTTLRTFGVSFLQEGTGNDFIPAVALPPGDSLKNCLPPTLQRIELYNCQLSAPPFAPAVAAALESISLSGSGSSFDGGLEGCLRLKGLEFHQATLAPGSICAIPTSVESLTVGWDTVLRHDEWQPTPFAALRRLPRLRKVSWCLARSAVIRTWRSRTERQNSPTPDELVAWHQKLRAGFQAKFPGISVSLVF